MKRRRPTTRLRPAPERLEEKRLPSAIPGLHAVPTIHVSAVHQTQATLHTLAHERRVHIYHKPTHGAGGNGGVGLGVGNGVGAGVGSGIGQGNNSGNGQGGGGGIGWGLGATALTVGPDSGLLGSPVGMVLAVVTPPVGGAVYNLALITVRNGTSQTFTEQSGLSVEVSGSSSAQPFPLGSFQWKPGQVLVVYSLNEDTFAPDFTFNLEGTSTEVPANNYYGIQFSPNTISSVLNSIVTTELVGGRYQVVST
jgi:hypothetical protein